MRRWGSVLHFTGQATKQAIESLERALRLDPEFNLWMHALGRVLFVLGRYAEAEAMFRRRLIHMPASDVSRAYPASLYGHTNRPEEAQSSLERAHGRQPQYTIDLTLRIRPYRNPRHWNTSLRACAEVGSPARRPAAAVLCSVHVRLQPSGPASYPAAPVRQNETMRSNRRSAAHSPTS